VHNVSIILISHNKYPLNLFTLYSLENQTYEQSKMEVILVDDNSTDQTAALKGYRAPFCFKYCRSSSNLGRAGAKNFGIKKAEGKIIIFLDAEVMVAPDFVANHLRHHSAEQGITVSGNLNHFRIFSVLYPGFSKKQARLLHSCIQDERILIKLLAQHPGLPSEHFLIFNKFWYYTRQNQKPVPLITKEDIATQRFKQLSFPSWHFFSPIIRRYGNDLTGFNLAWIFFITRNVSLRKSILDKIGLFNEDFKGWGSEDWELGYRLFKNGVKFIEDPDIISYHQEHPFSRKNRMDEKMLNYAKFIDMHPEIEVCALTLNFLKKRRFLQINYIVEDYYQLKINFPNQFVHSQNAFIELTRQIPVLIAEGKPVTRLLQHTGMEKNPDKKKKLLEEIESLRRTGKYQHYLRAFDLLLSL
jgi:glycosyltransferase involved in cell wall biosynthesis